MLRSLDIPAREVTGFVPGDRSTLTNEYVVRANQAHAWAEVFFPGVGWQAFDPTANVPLAGDARGPESLWSWVGHHALELLGLAAIAGAMLALATFVRRVVSTSRTRRTRSWAARRFDDLERLGSTAGRQRLPSETAPEYANALARMLDADGLRSVGVAIDADAFSPGGIGSDQRAAADAILEGVGAKPRGS
jgi:hypothetical protein